MVRTACVLVLAAVVAAGLTVSAEPELPPHVERVLRDIRAKDTGQLAVSEEDGRFLRVLIAASGAKRALEIGGASGYSAIWMGLGLRQTGGRLVTIEYDGVRAKELAANIKRAGLSDVVQVIGGDAFEHIPAMPGSFDFVFSQAVFEHVRNPFRAAEELVRATRPGGLVVRLPPRASTTPELFCSSNSNDPPASGVRTNVAISPSVRLSA